MNHIWTETEAATATGGEIAGSWKATGVSIDSRTVEAGDLFIALDGDNGDGHSWVGDALAKGAVAAMVHRRIEGADPARLLVVEDTMAGLEALGRAARDRMTAKVIGVTS